jgi:3-oxoacyl-[acyl-carrier-protein] synthase III
MDVYAGAVAYALGDKRAVAESRDVGASGLTEYFLAQGLSSYRCSDLAPDELAFEAARQTLELMGPRAGEIDGILYATTTFGHPHAYGSSIGRLCNRLGLSDVDALGVYFAQCGNLLSAIRVGSAYARSGLCDNVLVIATDKATSGAERITANNVSVNSDGAVSLLLRASREAMHYRVLDTFQVSDHVMWINAGPDDRAKRMNIVFRGVKKLAKAVRSSAAYTEDIALLITNNYVSEFLDVIRETMPAARARHLVENVAEHAHVYSADTFINLESARRRNLLALGDVALIVSTGFGTWLAALVEYVG